MVIDTHAHIIVPEITRPSAPGEGWRPDVRRVDGVQVVDFAGKQIKSAVQEFVDIEGILAAQGRAGVDHTLLCPWVSILRYNAPIHEAIRSGQIQNEALSKLAESYPAQISALGTVPLQEPDQAAVELRRLMQMPGIKGVEIGASVNGAYLGDDRFLPFWAAAEETAAFVFIHPSIRGLDVPEDFYMWNTVGNPLETTVTAAHMAMAGVMETFPGLKVMLSHGGGAILALRGRLNHAYGFQPLARKRLKNAPGESLKKFYFDTITHDPDILRNLVDFAGPEHVMVGSDYPFDMGAARPAEIVRSLGLPPSDEEKILAGNARRLLDLEV